MFSSSEKKASETAEILATKIHLQVTMYPNLSEMDRDTTGYLPKTDFEATADEFFARPMVSVKGWETANAAQKRIVAILEHIMDQNQAQSVAVFSHGGVGALALSFYLSEPISRKYDQSESVGTYFVIDMDRREVLQQWQPFDRLLGSDG